MKIFTRVLLTSIPMLFLAVLNAQMPAVNQVRLEKTLFELANYGKDTNGETHRVAFSDADIAGRQYVIGLMKEAGMEVSVDYAGNLIGKVKGADPDKKAIAFGSHIDMVPNGGNYDGIVGSLAAIEVVKTFHENGIKTRHPLEVIIFSNEEGGVMGSRALAGQLGPDALKVINSTGYTMAEGIQRIGGDTTRLQEVVRDKGSLKAFLELHIEQGGILEQENIDIGIVEGIVGLQWWDVRVRGFANHAGTTPMDMRQDALLSAARFVLAVNEIINSHEGKHVGTVGRIKALPGAPNVIPGEVVMSLEIRDLSWDKIQALFKEIKDRAEDIGRSTNTTYSFLPLDATAKPAHMDSGIKKHLEEVTQSLKLTYKYMQSGAGHDAQDMALIAPSGMIFVPSRGGISHSPKEFTSAADMANGANVLLKTILTLDKN